MKIINKASKNTIKKIATYAVWAGISGLFGILSACSDDATSRQPNFASVNITGANYAKDFELIDHNGKTRHLSDFPGKVIVLFFGYTQCPDVCPTSMSELAQIKKNLGAEGERVQVLFVTVDPERDTPEMLKEYMGSFDPSFLALYTSKEKLADIARNFKIYYKKIEGKTPTSYTIDHSAGNYVYDTKGQLRLFTRYGSDPKGLTEDIRVLLKTP